MLNGLFSTQPWCGSSSAAYAARATSPIGLHDRNAYRHTHTHAHAHAHSHTHAHIPAPLPAHTGAMLYRRRVPGAKAALATQLRAVCMWWACERMLQGMKKKPPHRASTQGMPPPRVFALRDVSKQAAYKLPRWGPPCIRGGDHRAHGGWSAQLRPAQARPCLVHYALRTAVHD